MMKDALVTLTKELITIPSTSDNIEGCLKTLELAKNKLSEYSFTPYVSEHIPSMLFRNTDEPINKFKVILNAHLDVVPPSNDNQLSAYEKDGKLYGRGAYDMKSGAAAMILVFKELGKTLPYPLGLQLTTDEEVAGQNGTKYQLSQGIRTDFCITGEGSGLRVIHASKGRLLLKLSIKGKNAHSAYPWLGKNAIWQMYEGLGDLMEHYTVPQTETSETTINIARIETTNNTFNKIPDECVAYLDIRYLAEEKDTILKKITSLLPDTISIEVANQLHPHHTNHENPYVLKLQEAGMTVLGHKLPLGRAHGGSDASYYSEVGNEAVEFGPIGHGHHGENEWIDIQSLENYYQILKTFLLSLI